VDRQIDVIAKVVVVVFSRYLQELKEKSAVAQFHHNPNK
jgi:hypothetical protein